MGAPRKSGVADNAGSTEAARATPPPAQSASAVDKKTTKNQVERKGSKKHPETSADGANLTKEDGASYRSRSHPYANSFRKVMADWMSAHFPDDARHEETLSNEPGKTGPKSAVKQGPQPTLAQYLGWLDSLEDRDEASANNTSTKMYWRKFCEQTQNKKMVASWVEFARDVRTVDGLLKFRPAFGHINFDISPGGRLHPLISFPSAGYFKDNTSATLARQDDDDHDDSYGSKKDDAVIRRLTAAGSNKTDAAPTKRARQDAQDEDGDDSGDVAGHRAKKRRQQKTARPSSSSSRSARVPKFFQLAQKRLQLKQRLIEVSGLLQLPDSPLQPHFEAKAGERTQKGNETNFEPVKREYSP